MKKLNYVIVMAICSVAALVGCSMGQGGISNGKDSDANVSKEVKIGNFYKVHAESGIKIVFSQGKNNGIAKIATTESAKQYLEVGVKDGELYAKYKPSTKRIKGPSIITVSSPNLEEVDLSSGAVFTAKGNLSLNKDLEVSLSSGSSAQFNKVACMIADFDLSSGASANVKSVDCNKFSGDASSAGFLSIEKVTATNMEAEASSGAKIEVDGFDGTKVVADASSGAEVYVSGITSVKVDAEASSGGKVTLAGVCSTLDKESSSGGRVETARLSTDRNPSDVKKGGNGIRIP